MYRQWRNELIGQPLGEEKMSHPQKCKFWEKVPKNLKTYFAPYDYLLWLDSQNGGQLR